MPPGVLAPDDAETLVWGGVGGGDEDVPHDVADMDMGMLDEAELQRLAEWEAEITRLVDEQADEADPENMLAQ